MVIAFEKFEEINKLGNVIEKQRAWLKDYEDIHYSIAYEEKHQIKWQTEKKFYHDTKFDPKINCMGRKKNRTIIEFDGQTEEEINKAKEGFKKVKTIFKEKGWGFIESSHQSKKTNYLWVEFNRDMKDKEVENFLVWICPKDGSIIDMNFASSRKVFAVLYATHWRHSHTREIPLEYFKGEQIDFDYLNIPITKKVKKYVVGEDGFNYMTYQAAKVFGKKGQAEQFENIQPLFFDKNGLWWLWNNNLYKWEIVDEVDILNMIEKATGQDIITPKERTLILNSLKQEGRKHIPLPIKPTWIQFKNEIFDVITGERFEATAKYFVTNPIPYNLNKDNVEYTPIMDKIFEEWVGKDYIKTLYEILAYSMIPDYPINRLFCFIGGGMNGKSKFLELLRRFIGVENCCTTELDTLLISRFEITRLHKKLVCMMGETNFNEISKTSILKKLTGGDLIGFEYKNKNPFDEQNYAKILIATNNLPSTTDKTMGFYRRWMIIDFPNKFSEAKNILDDIPLEEYECLALKCCAILKDILTNRKFTNEGSVEDRMEKYEAKSNFLEKFIKETTREDMDGYITKNDFFKKFTEWSKEHKHREMSETSVGMAMKKLGIETDKRYFNWLFDGKGGQLRCWIGLKWAD
jgi:P4 family phage/plasmid primase-like protien